MGTPADTVFIEFLGPTLVMLANGLLTSLLFACSEHLRRLLRYRILASVYLLCWLVGYTNDLPNEPVQSSVTYWLFMLACCGSLPVFVYTLAGVLTAAIERTTAPTPSAQWRRGVRWRRQLKRALRRGDLQLVERKRQQLHSEPANTELRGELIDLLLAIEDVEDALYHLYVLVEMLPRGHTHAYTLFRLAQVLADQKDQLQQAQPYLRRLLRLYPRSYFASYARRLINRYEAYADR